MPSLLTYGLQLGTPLTSEAFEVGLLLLSLITIYSFTCRVLGWASLLRSRF